jgi:hypothetical protein
VLVCLVQFTIAFKRRNNDKVRQMDTIEGATKLLSDVGVLNFRNAEVTILVEIFQVHNSAFLPFFLSTTACATPHPPSRSCPISLLLLLLRGGGGGGAER